MTAAEKVPLVVGQGGLYRAPCCWCTLQLSTEVTVRGTAQVTAGSPTDPRSLIVYIFVLYVKLRVDPERQIC